ncbi:MAG: hypothetical protein JWL68_1163, partial [Actinomycetia bacterium]|nr:hypothetical protein [Actinomycetes bacterium]
MISGGKARGGGSQEQEAGPSRAARPASRARRGAVRVLPVAAAAS